MNFLVTCIWPRSAVLLLIFVSGQGLCNGKTLNDQTEHLRGRRRELAGRQDWAAPSHPSLVQRNEGKWQLSLADLEHSWPWSLFTPVSLPVGLCASVSWWQIEVMSFGKASGCGRELNGERRRLCWGQWHGKGVSFLSSLFGWMQHQKVIRELPGGSERVGLSRSPLFLPQNEIGIQRGCLSRHPAL